MRETFSRSRPDRSPRASPAAPVAQRLHRTGREALRSARVIDVERASWRARPRVETLRRQAQGDGVINTAYIERLNARFVSVWPPDTPEARTRASHADAATGWIDGAYNFCTPHTSLAHAGGQTTPAMAAGITDHCWSVQDLLSYHVPPPRWTPPSTVASFACAQTPHKAVVWGPRLAVELPGILPLSITSH